MTAEPIRQRGDEEERPHPEDPQREAAPEGIAEPDAPSADESLIDSATQPVTAPGESLTPEAAESAEAQAAAEADPNMDPNATEAEVAAADAQEAATTAEAVATIDAVSEPAADSPPTDTSGAQAASRRRGALGGLRTLAVVAIVALLLVGGVALGTYIFQTARANTGAAAGPASSLVDPPPAAQEFIAALAANDEDAVRSSLDMEPHKDLMREMERRAVQKVNKIEVLGTAADGPRSATEILMQYQREDGISTAINLVILVDDGKIEGFR